MEENPGASRDKRSFSPESSPEMRFDNRNEVTDINKEQEASVKGSEGVAATESLPIEEINAAPGEQSKQHPLQPEKPPRASGARRAVRIIQPKNCNEEIAEEPISVTDAAEKTRSQGSAPLADAAPAVEESDIAPAKESSEEDLLWQQTAAKKAKKKKRIGIICNIAISVFSAIFVFSAVKFGMEIYNYKKIDQMLEDQRKEYEPTMPSETANVSWRPGIHISIDPSTDSELPSEGSSGEIVDSSNPTVVAAQAKYPDVCGWITIQGTNIKNLYVKGRTYDDYLRQDLNGNYITAGTLFLEPLCTRDFSSFNTIMFGHNMKNGTMFGDLPKFKKADYFNEHPTGTVFLANKTYGLQIFAFLLVSSDDEVLYDPYIETVEEKENFLSYIKKNAKQYRDVGASVEDTFLTMSTCSYDFENARYILVARLMSYE